MIARLKALARQTAGSVAMVFGIAAPVLVGVAGIAVDYARYNTTVANLQGLADGAAVAAVRSMAVANMTESAAAASVDSYVKQKAEEMVDEMCRKLLANPTKDNYSFKIEEEK
jgi:Flp pilus assembly protein TadG